MSGSAKNKKPVDTGIKEMMSGIFESPAMEDALQKMERMQSVSALSVSKKDTHNNIHTDTYIDMGVNTLNDTVSKKDTHIQIDTDIDINMYSDMHTGTVNDTHSDTQNADSYLQNIPDQAFFAYVAYTG